MKLYEYKAKEILKKYGIPVPDGFVVSSPDRIKTIPGPVMVKAQVLIGGRGKAGGIKPANTVDEAKKVASAILGMDIRGYKTQDVLIERRLDIAKEMYLGITVDRSNRSLLLMASPSGGVDIESVPEDKILMAPVDPLIGYQPYLGRRVASFMGLQKEQASQVVSICHRLYQLVMSEDAELAEINPLVVTKDGKVVAGDAKITIDSDALFRHNEYERLHEDLTPLEEKAKRLDIAFVQLDGNIGVIANGAGLTMATLDSLNMYGGEAGVFLDLGGTDDPEKVKSAMLLMVEAKPKVILLNIFGGITKCDTVAKGVLEAIGARRIGIPIVARIKGVNEDLASTMLKDAGMIPAHGLSEAAELAARESQKVG
ncbi:MAG: ADP-forming succinate--CoA ligase subunit beta [Thermoplasmata archaeon]|jgi:succinyl-CoA synthetase beta subunit|nr:ADP-forming succinate--CoA ligase subunit beta [Thermoplasmata archaeon]